jgi:FG-GAP-like repeat
LGRGIAGWAAAADLNGDSLLDIVATDGFGTFAPVTLYSWLALGGRTFGPPAAVAAGHYPIAAALADVNGDGKMDFVALCNWAAGLRDFAVLYFD